MIRRFASALAVVAVLGLIVTVTADEGKTQTTKPTRLKVGETCPNFTNLETVDGKTVSLDDIKSDVLVLCITCNHCPMAVKYEDRIIKWVKNVKENMGDKVTFVAINVNNNNADKLDAMKVRAKEKGFNFTYAYDPSQQIARKLGATVTPEFFVFNKERKLVYAGAMDNNNEAEKADKCFLSESVSHCLNGTPAPTCTKGRGCGIQYEKSSN
jgi:cytochrome oxidase Cu insertion factor (SCO1/SenC/PrrC family)